MNQCNFSKDDFDSKGNFIIPNKTNNNFGGKEKYFAPYGFFGIGLNVSGKHEENAIRLFDKT